MEAGGVSQQVIQNDEVPKLARSSFDVLPDKYEMSKNASLKFGANNSSTTHV